jgi:acetate kinase
MNILVLNCGSSSAKFAVIDSATGREAISGIAQRLGSEHATLDWKMEGTKRSRAVHNADHAIALRAVVELLQGIGLVDDLCGVGHRVVHGGAKFSGSIPITDVVVAKIEECIPLGPLHNPPNLLGIQIAQELFPTLPQVAVFDTAFHQTMPPQTYLYAVPYEWFEKHEVRRYGFHGTSHRYVSEQAVRQLGLDPEDHNLVTCHLGNGCSLAAVRNGKSMDTTMGLTPLDGVVMGTRSGSIDPSIVVHMKNMLGISAAEVQDQLNRKSGLLGISGLSNDMRTLHNAAQMGHARAALAIDKFCHAIAKAAAGMMVSLGRLDALVFTGGIGENAAFVREKVVDLLAFAGLVVDPTLNATHGKATAGRITRSVRPQALVVPTNEELMIAMDTAEIVASGRCHAAAVHGRRPEPVHVTGAAQQVAPNSPGRATETRGLALRLRLRRMRSIRREGRALAHPFPSMIPQAMSAELPDVIRAGVDDDRGAFGTEAGWRQALAIVEPTMASDATIRPGPAVLAVARLRRRGGRCLGASSCPT